MREVKKKIWKSILKNAIISNQGILMGYVKVHQSMESHVKPIRYGIINHVRYLMVFDTVSVGISQVMSNYARVVLRLIIVFYGCFVYQDMLEYIKECYN